MDDLIERLRQYADEPYRANASGEWQSLITEAADALEAAREDAWQPIETAPKDGTRILLCSSGGAVWMGHWIGRSGAHVINGWTRYNCVDVNWNPTHWMPLPAPPKEARNG